MDSLSLRVIIPDFPVLSFKYVHILHAYAYVLEVPFHMSSLRTFTDRLLWVHALRIPTRQKIPEAGKGGAAVFRSEDESTFRLFLY